MFVRLVVLGMRGVKLVCFMILYMKGMIKVFVNILINILFDIIYGFFKVLCFVNYFLESS